MPVQLSYDIRELASRMHDWLSNELLNRKRRKFVLGLSGGLDSATVLSLAVDAVGPEKVIAVWMPCDAWERDEHAYDIANKFDVEIVDAPIGGVAEIIEDQIPSRYDDWDPLKGGNLRARLRMLYLYQIAHCEESLVLGTGNRSEYLTGYFTKWGDGACDLDPILALYKTEVRELARWQDIPKYIIEKPPSAGFYEGQTDEHDLRMTYELLDQILDSFMRHMDFWPNWYRTHSGAIERYGEDNVEHVRSLVLNSHHKREAFMNTYPPYYFRFPKFRLKVGDSWRFRYI